MLNKIIVMGRLVRDPESKPTASGVSCAAFTLACDRDYVPKGQEREADFLDCVAWQRAADFAQMHFVKGRMAVVEGRLQINHWTATDGSKRKAAQIAAERVYFADGKPRRGEADDTSHMPATPAEAGFTAVEDAELPF